MNNFKTSRYFQDLENGNYKLSYYRNQKIFYQCTNLTVHADYMCVALAIFNMANIAGYKNPSGSKYTYLSVINNIDNFFNKLPTPNGLDTYNKMKLLKSQQLPFNTYPISSKLDFIRILKEGYMFEIGLDLSLFDFNNVEPYKFVFDDIALHSVCISGYIYNKATKSYVIEVIDSNSTKPLYYTLDEFWTMYLGYVVATQRNNIITSMTLKDLHMENYEDKCPKANAKAFLLKVIE